jgi:hypothetical protein
MDQDVEKEPAGFREFLYRQKQALLRLPTHLRRYQGARAFAAKERPHLIEARRRCEAEYAKFDRPLVTVTIPTYNRAQILVERTLPSVLEQSYENFECLVVGDACPDDTSERIQQITDPRLRFINLPKRGAYPANPHWRWLVAGAVPCNYALRIARGKWIVYLDDDDTLTKESIEERLEHAYATNAELVHARMASESSPGLWEEGGGQRFPSGRFPFPKGGVPHSSVIYRGYLRFFEYDLFSYNYERATDNWLWHRMARAGVRTAYLHKVVCRQPLRPNELQRTAEAMRSVLAAEQY